MGFRHNWAHTCYCHPMCAAGKASALGFPCEAGDASRGGSVKVRLFLGRIPSQGDPAVEQGTICQAGVVIYISLMIILIRNLMSEIILNAQSAQQAKPAATAHVPVSSTAAGSKAVATEEALQKVGVNSAALKLLASAEKDQSRDTSLPTPTPTPCERSFKVLRHPLVLFPAHLCLPL